MFARVWVFWAHFIVWLRKSLAFFFFFVKHKEDDTTSETCVWTQKAQAVKHGKRTGSGKHERVSRAQSWREQFWSLYSNPHPFVLLCMLWSFSCIQTRFVVSLFNSASVLHNRRRRHCNVFVDEIVENDMLLICCFSWFYLPVFLVLNVSVGFEIFPCLVQADLFTCFERTT